MTERDHWKDTLGKAAIITVTVGTGIAILSAGTQEQQPQTTTVIPGFEPQSESFSFTPNATPPSDCPEGWHGRPIREGEWPLKLIREFTEPDNFNGPFKLIHLDGTVQTFENWRQFTIVYPGETLCLEENSSPTNFNQGKTHGKVYEGRRNQIKNEVNLGTARARDVQATIRAKQGF